MSDKSERKQPTNAGGTRLGRVWAAIGVLATLVGLITFLALDLPELIGGYFAPPPFSPAADDEVLVIVSDFTGQGSEVDTRIFRALRQRVAESNLERVRVERLEGVAPMLAEDAVAIGEKYGATLVIWGTVDGYGIEPRYEVVRHQEIIKGRADLGVTTAADLPTFSAYVVESVPKEFDYLMLFSLGQMAYFSGDWRGAVDLFGEALNVDLGERGPELNLATVYFYRGLSYAKLGDHQAAVADYTRTIELDPQSALAHYDRGIAYYLSGDPVAALTDYTRAIELDPRHARAYYGRGLAHSGLGDLPAAIADYTRAVELDPQYAEAYNNRAWALAISGGDLEGALADVEQAIQLSPQESSYYDTRGHVYYKLGDYDAALGDFDHALELGNAFSYYGRGLVYEARGEVEAALSDYERFLEAYPDHPPESDDVRRRIEELRGQ